MQNTSIKLIGLYSVDEHPDVTLVELLINKKANEFDVGEFTQEIEHQPRLNWQTPFGEKYLSLDGEMIVGDDTTPPEFPAVTTRLVFFFYFLDPSKPMITAFGQLQLTPKQEQPKRIMRLIKFEDPE